MSFMSQEVVKRLVDELAPVVWAERCHEAAATKPPQTVPWYFINIQLSRHWHGSGAGVQHCSGASAHQAASVGGV